MFDHPSFPWQEFSRAGTKSRFKSRLREEELKDFARNRTEELEKHVRVTHIKGIKERVEYLGLTSQDLYDEEGNLIKKSQTFNADPDTEFVRRTGYNPMKLYELAEMGLDFLPRTTAPPKVEKDSNATTSLINSGKLSKKALNVLKRTDYRLPFRLTPDIYDDDWSQRAPRFRHMQVLVTIMHTAMLRSDFATAWKVFPLLVRFTDVDIRRYWTIGVELLNQRTQNPERGLAFLDWLFVNHPSVRFIRKVIWKIRPRALELLPYLLMIKLANGNAKDVRGQIEDLVLSKPYADDPNSWALYGITLLHLGEHLNAKSKFERCEQLGGHLPKSLWQEVKRRAPVASGGAHGETSESETDIAED